ncbi:TPA: hypothetical protein SMP24_002589 [Proteus mirabilis]|uniref:hypothetical protein n=2 Tax=Proteus mirabilis TaxID=584 RepID=UPI000D7E2DEC|nr:hypothetical protein [Proteus mirabilis]AWS55611.1 hypothetical protein AM356_12535 [Proteus mirabilis]EKX5075782.1 hypothetical protein [Proteus mirabilis]ELB2728188.1 hypothetical protein [Proteus mirabilis]ELN3979930.1 hypothetical protein [Proteus mirabilis]ELN5385569.1 hypothetical protein [Proteus mirabilis]
MHSFSNDIEKDIMHILYKSAYGLDAYTIFRRLKIPFSNFSKALLSLNEKKLIKESREDFYTISTEGKLLIIKINSKNVDTAWNEIPKKYKSKNIPSNSKYIPSIHLLDKSTFKIK